MVYLDIYDIICPGFTPPKCTCTVQNQILKLYPERGNIKPFLTLNTISIERRLPLLNMNNHESDQINLTENKSNSEC